MSSNHQRRTINKTNATQKKIMIDFMLQHPELARNTLISGNHGKTLAQCLWATLTTKLNAAGPPVKDVKTWRKVYADQKHSIKKKISMQKHLNDSDISFKRVDQKIIRAAGLSNDTEDESSMSGLDQYAMFSNMSREDPFENEYFDQQNLQRFDIIEIKEEVEEDIPQNNSHNSNSNNNNNNNSNNIKSNNKNSNNNNDKNINDENDDNDNEDNHNDNYAVNGLHDMEVAAEPISIENMVAHLNEQFQDFADDQKLASAKLDRLIKMNENLIKMKERSLKMKEEQHAMDMALKRIDLEIKTLELKALQSKSVVNVCI